MAVSLLKRRVLNGLTRYVAPSVMRAIYRSNTLLVENEEIINGLINRGQNYILAFWHGQMLPLLSFFRGRGLYTFISPHRDGEYIARTLQGLGNYCVRTSLRDRRIRALGQALKLTREGNSLALTPDGPLGPAFQAKSGILKLSEKLEVPILPAVGLPSRPIFFSSWDRFCFPLPLGTIQIRFCPTFSPWRSKRSIEQKQLRLQQILNDASYELARDVLPESNGYPNRDH